ncbi:hypothetical protein RJ55_01914 [Drechmeria coniospora]|nr:hypothetical protein RJ55_01914 [Drechmeria coniospora]
MAEASLQDRLREHAKAFDGLLSLIPAKMYYGEDNTDQWQRKKQTKQEAAAARRGKLDPDSELNRNAKQVMDERASNKRKLRELEKEQERGQEQDEEDGLNVSDLVESEQPGEGLRACRVNGSKKQKLDEDANEGLQSSETPSKVSKKELKKAAKKERKADRKVELRAKAEEKPPTPSRDKSAKVEDPESTPGSGKRQKSKGKRDATPSKLRQAESSGRNRTTENDKDDVEGARIPNLSLDMSLLTQKAVDGAASMSLDVVEPTVGDASGEVASTATSTSPPRPASEKPKQIKIPADTTALRARLAAKIEALRAARKADGPDGKPIRTRQELIEARRAKEAKRKEHKKELRMLAKAEEAKKREAALASNSPGVLSPAVELNDAAGNFSFGRVAFGDGSQMSHDLSYVLAQGKKKGPSDPKTALLKVQNQKKRLQELDSDKRTDVEEKDAWLTARRRIEGEKIRDDEAMLKRSIKRKETAKKKSEKAWKERSNGVGMAQKERQKKREENLKKRRDEKLLGKAGKKKKGGAKKKGGRPGFEGSLGVGGRKKK